MSYKGFYAILVFILAVFSVNQIYVNIGNDQVTLGINVC